MYIQNDRTRQATVERRPLQPNVIVTGAHLAHDARKSSNVSGTDPRECPNANKPRPATAPKRYCVIAAGSPFLFRIGTHGHVVVARGLQSLRKCARKPPLQYSAYGQTSDQKSVVLTPCLFSLAQDSKQNVGVPQRVLKLAKKRRRVVLLEKSCNIAFRRYHESSLRAVCWTRPTHLSLHWRQNSISLSVTTTKSVNLSQDRLLAATRSRLQKRQSESGQAACINTFSSSECHGRKWPPGVSKHVNYATKHAHCRVVVSDNLTKKTNTKLLHYAATSRSFQTWSV